MGNMKPVQKNNLLYRSLKCKECGTVYHTDISCSNCIKCGKKYPKVKEEEVDSESTTPAS